MKKTGRRPLAKAILRTVESHTEDVLTSILSRFQRRHLHGPAPRRRVWRQWRHFHKIRLSKNTANIVQTPSTPSTFLFRYTVCRDKTGDERDWPKAVVSEGAPMDADGKRILRHGGWRRLDGINSGQRGTTPKEEYLLRKCPPVHSSSNSCGRPLPQLGISFRPFGNGRRLSP